jgi:molecular chaperone DnaK
MTRDAEAHSDEDKKKRQLAEAKNEADTLVYTVEKSVKDYSDKITEAEKKEIEESLERCKQVKESSNEAAEIKSATEDLMKKSHKLAEHMYKGQGEQAGAGPSGPSGAETSGAQEQAEAKSPEEEVVEAEFEDVDKDKK